MVGLGKVLMGVGVVLLGVGIVVWGMVWPGFRGLPGDVRMEGERFTIYFPWVSCLVVSVVVTLMWWLWRWLSGK